MPTRLLAAAALGLTVCAAAGCTPQPVPASPVGREAAVHRAQAMLAQSPDAADFVLDSVTVTATDSSWLVQIARAGPVRRVPNFALLEVHRLTGRTMRHRVR